MVPELREKIAQSMRLRYFAITKPGIIALTLAVCALWGCFAVEQITLRRADNELRASLKTIRLLQRAGAPAQSPNGQPVSRPLFAGPQRAASA